MSYAERIIETTASAQIQVETASTLVTAGRLDVLRSFIETYLVEGLTVTKLPNSVTAFTWKKRVPFNTIVYGVKKANKEFPDLLDIFINKRGEDVYISTFLDSKVGAELQLLSAWNTILVHLHPAIQSGPNIQNALKGK